MAAVILRVIVVLSTLISVSAIPEQGKWIVNLDEKNQFVGVAKHMYKGSRVTVTVSLKCGEHTEGVDISWLLRMSPCAMEFISAADDIKHVGNDATKKIKMENYMKMPLTQKGGLPYNEVEWMNGYYSHNCSEQEFKLEGDPNQKPEVYTIPKPLKNVTGDKPVESSDSKSAAQESSKTASSEGKKTDEKVPPASSDKEKASDKKETPADKSGKPQSSADGSAKKDNSADKAVTSDSAEKKVASNSSSRKKRDESRQKADTDAKKPEASATAAVTKGPTAPHNPDKLDHPDVATVWRDGNYLFVLRLRPKGKDAAFKAEVTIRTFYGDENYISAMDYPLLIFYGVMGLVYIVYGLVWLVLLACNWRDLLRVQFWIGGVILLGMLEKAVFFAEYENINKTGQSVRGAVIFAELMSCLKQTLAWMLVIIISLGFGIIKPRLGQAFHKVLFVGGLYFILASIEGCMRATTPKADQSNQFLLAGVPRAVLKAIICWWIISSLIQTTRTLRLRRNVVKLTMYRHFTNTLIFAALASVACMVWTMTQHKFKECIKDWKQLWIDEAFWHMLFVILLFIIMLLWRPTANNQRYAFSPLLDAADEEDDEDAMMYDAFDDMKIRGVKASNGSPKPKDPESKVEDDLKWVEENIPSSVADKALSTLLEFI